MYSDDAILCILSIGWLGTTDLWAQSIVFQVSTIIYMASTILQNDFLKCGILPLLGMSDLQYFFILSCEISHSFYIPF